MHYLDFEYPRLFCFVVLHLAQPPATSRTLISHINKITLCVLLKYNKRSEASFEVASLVSIVESMKYRLNFQDVIYKKVEILKKKKNMTNSTTSKII